MLFFYFIFQDFWHFAGILIFIALIFNGIIGIIDAVRSDINEIYKHLGL